MAKGYEKMGNNHEAIASYNNALRELNDSKETKAKLFYDRSQLHSKMGEHSLAYNDLKIGNTLHPGNPDIKRELEKLEKQGLVGQSTTDAPVEAKKNDVKKNDPVAAGNVTPNSRYHCQE